MYDVFLYVYDLSNGLAAQISLQLTGKFFKAIYHTSIVIHGREYFFGGAGIESSLPGQSPYGSPIETRKIGTCAVNLQAWQGFLQHCAKDYGVGKYHLLEHNCNTFSDAALQFLLNTRIDPEISSLPSDFLNTPLGILLRPQIDAMYSPQRSNQDSVVQSTRLEATINGPTSGTRKDRIAEAYSFPNCPTLSKLFADQLAGAAKVLGANREERQQLQATTQKIVMNQIPSKDETSKLYSFLIGYVRTGDAEHIYPGIDLVRVLFPHNAFSAFMSEPGGELMDAILDHEFDQYQSSPNSIVVLLKLICNILLNDKTRVSMIEALRRHGKLDLITSGPLSTHMQVVELSLKTIWNILILVDGIDDDFTVACLAAVAECKADQSSVITSIRNDIIREITNGASEAVQEMVELLEIEC